MYLEKLSVLGALRNEAGLEVQGLAFEAPDGEFKVWCLEENGILGSCDLKSTKTGASSTKFYIRERTGRLTLSIT